VWCKQNINPWSKDDFFWTLGLNDTYFRSQELRACLDRRLDSFYPMKWWRHRVIKSISYLRGIIQSVSRHQIESRSNLEVYYLASSWYHLLVINIVRKSYFPGKEVNCNDWFDTYGFNSLRFWCPLIKYKIILIE